MFCIKYSCNLTVIKSWDYVLRKVFFFLHKNRNVNTFNSSRNGHNRFIRVKSPDEWSPFNGGISIKSQFEKLQGIFILKIPSYGQTKISLRLKLWSDFVDAFWMMNVLGMLNIVARHNETLRLMVEKITAWYHFERDKPMRCNETMENHKN